MLILPNCCLLATPKTGSQYCHAAVIAAVDSFTDVGRDAGSYHLKLKEVDSPAIAFVRHPLTWFQSYWNYRIRTGWRLGEVDIDTDCASGKFNEFVRQVVDKHPQWLTNYLSQWIGTRTKPAAFIGRFENLTEDLITGLHHFGEEFDETKIREAERVNQGNFMKHPADYEPGVAEFVMGSEAAIMQRFYSGNQVANAC